MAPQHVLSFSLTLVVVTVVVAIANHGDGGCCHAPSLKVNKCRKHDQGVYFCVVEGICRKMTVKFWASKEVGDKPGM